MESSGTCWDASFIERTELHQTASWFYLVGYTREGMCRLLKVSRREPHGLRTECSEEMTVDQCNRELRKVRDKTQAQGGLQPVCQSYGILGCFRFLEGFYFLFVTERRYVGAICGHRVYGIADVELVPLLHPSVRSDRAGSAGAAIAEKRYKRLLMSGLDLCKDFFFSYTYNLCNTLQANLSQPSSDPFCSRFVWNEYLTRKLREQVPSEWLLPVMHGYFEQKVLSVFGQAIHISLVSRRSRYFAGTRYLKRGVNDHGDVANDVETEQILQTEKEWSSGRPALSAIVQVRGSIPLYWSQEPSPLNVKPSIQLQHFDPLYNATSLHFDDLRRRYDNPVVVFNLVKAKEHRVRESVLRTELAHAVRVLNSQVAPEEQVKYIAWDFSNIAKSKGAEYLLPEMTPVLEATLRHTGLFVYMPKHAELAPPTASATSSRRGGAPPQFSPRVQLQRGVLRTNCIDCLDRTNVAQCIYGLIGLSKQLEALGLSDTSPIDHDSTMAVALYDMYEKMGNSIAVQYGGSEAHSAFFQRRKGHWESTMQSRDVLTSIRRFYSNNITDAEKQDAINLFLGNFVPQPNKPALWDLDSDYYLHAGAGRDASFTGKLPPLTRLTESHEEAQPLTPSPPLRQWEGPLHRTSMRGSRRDALQLDSAVSCSAFGLESGTARSSLGTNLSSRFSSSQALLDLGDEGACKRSEGEPGREKERLPPPHESLSSRSGSPEEPAAPSSEQDVSPLDDGASDSPTTPPDADARQFETSPPQTASSTGRGSSGKSQPEGGGARSRPVSSHEPQSTLREERELPAWQRAPVSALGEGLRASRGGSTQPAARIPTEEEVTARLDALLAASDNSLPTADEPLAEAPQADTAWSFRAVLKLPWARDRANPLLMNVAPPDRGLVSFDTVMAVPTCRPVVVRMHRDQNARQRTQPLLQFFKNTFGLAKYVDTYTADTRPDAVRNSADGDASPGAGNSGRLGFVTRSASVASANWPGGCGSGQQLQRRSAFSSTVSSEWDSSRPASRWPADSLAPGADFFEACAPNAAPRGAPQDAADAMLDAPLRKTPLAGLLLPGEPQPGGAQTPHGGRLSRAESFDSPGGAPATPAAGRHSSLAQLLAASLGRYGFASGDGAGARMGGRRDSRGFAGAASPPPSRTQSIDVGRAAPPPPPPPQLPPAAVAGPGAPLNGVVPLVSAHNDTLDAFGFSWRDHHAGTMAAFYTDGWVAGEAPMLASGGGDGAPLRDGAWDRLALSGHSFPSGVLASTGVGGQRTLSEADFSMDLPAADPASTWRGRLDSRRWPNTLGNGAETQPGLAANPAEPTQWLVMLSGAPAKQGPGEPCEEPPRRGPRARIDTRHADALVATWLEQDAAIAAAARGPRGPDAWLSSRPERTARVCGDVSSASDAAHPQQPPPPQPPRQPPQPRRSTDEYIDALTNMDLGRRWAMWMDEGPPHEWPDPLAPPPLGRSSSDLASLDRRTRSGASDRRNSGGRRPHAQDAAPRGRGEPPLPRVLFESDAQRGRDAPIDGPRSGGDSDALWRVITGSASSRAPQPSGRSPRRRHASLGLSPDIANTWLGCIDYEAEARQAEALLGEYTQWCRDLHGSLMDVECERALQEQYSSQCSTLCGLKTLYRVPPRASAAATQA